MAAFLTSIIVTLIMVGAVVWEGKHRPVGAKMTWGEAMVAALFIFALMLMAYGVVPDRWLRYADSELKWRTDKIGIPMGPMGHFLHSTFGIGTATNVIAPHGVKWFGTGRGKIVISANTVENVISYIIYGVGIAGHLTLAIWWNRRGRKPAKAALEKTSAYGRPLVRST